MEGVHLPIIECKSETCYPYHKFIMKNEEYIYKKIAMQLLLAYT